MTRGRLLAVGLFAWTIILGIALQPHPVRTPTVSHVRPLEPRDRDLPTLPPVG